MNTVSAPEFRQSPKGFGRGIPLAFILLIVFILISLGVVSNVAAPFDLAVGDWIRSFSSSFLTEVFKIITQFGSATLLVPIAVISIYYFLIILKCKREPVLLTLTLAGAALFEALLKHLFLRPRPSIVHLVTATGYSFPSGHSMCSTAFYGMLGYLLFANFKMRGKLTWYLPVVTTLVVLAIGASRIYLGVHYPTDVLGGFAIGGFWAIISYKIVHGYLTRIEDKDLTHSV